MAAKVITVKVGRGFEMEFSANVFEPKNWLYLNGLGKLGKGSRVVVDLNTGEILKGKGHSEPVFCAGEIARIVAMFK